MGLQTSLWIRRSAAVLKYAVVGAAALILLVGCGDTFRPVATPLVTPGGNPTVSTGNAIVVAANPSGTGTTANINLSGDTVSAVDNVGVAPVHAAIIGGDVVIANNASGTLSVYSLALSASPNTSVQTVTLAGTTPGASDAKPVFVAGTDNTNIYVAKAGTNAVGVVSLATLSESATPITDPSLTSPAAIAQLPNGTKVYVANAGSSNQVTVIDPAASLSTIRGTVNIGASTNAIVASADSNCVYVASKASNTVTVINTPTDTVTHVIPVGSGPTFLRFDSKLQRVYVANSTGASISIINHAADCSASTAITVGVGVGPQSIAALSDGTRVYVANADGSITVVDTSSNTVRKTISTGNAAATVSIGSSADGTRVIVANNSGFIFLIQTSDDTMFFKFPDATVNRSLPGAPKPQFVLMNP